MSTVAIVPAKDASALVATTVRALQNVETIDRVVVVDDGSTDDTAHQALVAGAEVVRLTHNRGKAAAVLAGAGHCPDADVFVLIDSDLGDTAALAGALIQPVVAGDADMTVAVFPPAGARAGFGRVRGLAQWGIRRATGQDVQAPLSGQRAMKAELLRGVQASRFGLEVALGIDVSRAGGRVLEIPLDMDHTHSGRSLSGFRHRGRQGVDVVRALWPRLTSERFRMGLMVISALLVVATMVASAGAAEPASRPWVHGADNVVIVGIPRWGLDDLGQGRVPNLDRLVDQGAFAAATVRTLSSRPSATEAYATLGAGSRVHAGVEADQALSPDDEVEGTTARELVQRRTGAPADGQVLVVTAAQVIRRAGDRIPSEPGLLGDTLAASGLRAAVVNNSDQVDGGGSMIVRRPAAVAVMDRNGVVPAGTVARTLLEEAATFPFGIRADRIAMLDAVQTAMADADVVVVDPGDTDRAGSYSAFVTESEQEAQRLEALRVTDEFVGDLVDSVGADTLVFVVGMTPPTSEWELTPMVALGPGAEPGYLHSPSTKREGLVTLTDLAPTVLAALDAPIPGEMIGSPMGLRPGTADVDDLRQLNDVAGGRERVYFGIAMTFIVAQAIFYILAVLVLTQRSRIGRAETALRYGALTFAAWPLASFLLRLVSPSHEYHQVLHPALIVTSVAIALVAGRARRHALSPLAWISGATVALLLVDISTGANLQMASLLGYSPHTAARFTGYGNTAFAVLIATAVVTAALHVHHAPRRREALVGAGCLLAVVLIADGFPMLGSDVGGILTMVPVFGLTLYVMSGRRVSIKVFLVAGLATAAVLGAATLVDLLRPEDDRSHLGRFVLSTGDDSGSAFTTIARKWETNLRVFRSSQWTWMVPITAGYMIYVLAVARGWGRLLPERSALRAGVVGTVVAGLLGWAVNDSGVVVAALVFVYVGPFLTLLALRALDPEVSVLVAPEPPQPPRVG